MTEYVKKVIKLARFSGPTPRCVSRRQYFAWKEQARISAPSDAVGFCEDCTPEYQAEMKAAARCENTGVRFFMETLRKKLDPKTKEPREVGGMVYGAFEPDTHHDGIDGVSVTDLEVWVEGGKPNTPESPPLASGGEPPAL
jgi:hypothetical protein